MINDDEREAREWLRNKADHRTHPYSDKCRTILALLDRPTLPHPEELTDVVMVAMLREFQAEGEDSFAMRAAYRTLYDHYMQPPAPKPLGWAVLGAFDYGGPVLFYDKQNAIVFSDKYGGRVVKLVEDSDDR